MIRTDFLRHGGAAAFFLLAAASCAGAQGAGPGGPGQPPSVTVVTLHPQDVTLTATLPGRIKASAEAEVRPQVAGIITERLFREGSTVQAGDALYTIDPATYEAAVQQAEAAVTQAEAQLRAAERDFARVEELRSRNVTSQQSADDATTARESAHAALQLAKAQLTAAGLELERTTIRARLSGEIGLSQTSRGALVTSGQAQPLAVIRNIDPVYVDVTQAAADMLAWRRGLAQSLLSDTHGNVTLVLADGTPYDEKGSLTAAEPHVDEQTGVVVLRMQFENPDKLLLPGMYVQVDMPTGVARDVFLAPQEGVTRDRRGVPTAYVVNSENVIEARQLTILDDSSHFWIVSDGLAPGDRMVVAGFQRIAPGATVTPEERTEAPAAAPAAGQ
ncbi:MAG: efflux RND transporter periplasmic adaptor subunit [Qingshengfaniella sp.]